MATFNEWLFFEEIREEVYLGSLRRLAVQEAVREVMEFCGMAVAGRWDLIVENYDEDDDGPVPDYDPFADGDEDAKPVELPAPREIASRIRRKKKKRRKGATLPSELRSGRGDWTPPSDDDTHASTEKRWQGLRVQDDLGGEDDGEESEVEKSKTELDIASGVDFSEIVKTAKRIQRLWFLTRWAAMLDRRDAIARVADIYRSEVAPVIGLEEWSHVREAYDDDFAPIKFDDDDPKKTEEQKQRELNDAAVKLKPLLEKLGYLRDEHLSYENGTDFILERARMAMAEEGNEPPEEEEEVQEMEKNPLIRTENRNKLFLEMHQLLEAAAKKQERKLSARFRDSEGRSRESSLLSMSEILSDDVLRAIEKITTREVLKDGTVKPWDESINAFKIEVEDDNSARHYLNSLKSPTSRGSSIRDKKKKDYEAAATSPSSKDAPVSMDAPVAGSEGESTTMAVADTKQRSADKEAEEGETGKILMDAFKQAMLKLKEQHPDWAVLLCLWLGLQDPPSLCAQKAGEVNAQSIGRIRDAMMGVSLTSRDARKTVLKKMGQNNLIGRTDRGADGISNWELVKAIKENVPNPSGVMAGMPSGNLPPNWTPIYSQRHTFDENQKDWWDYTGKVVHRLNTKVIPFVWDRMSQIASERNEDERASGQESSCSWSLDRFLKNAFRDQLKSGGAAIEGAGPEWKMIWRLKDPKTRRMSGNRDIRSFSITLQDGGVKIARNGWEGDSRFFKIPTRNVLCPECGGVGGKCPECEGCGYIMNRLEALKIERDIHAYLISTRKRR